MTKNIKTEIKELTETVNKLLDKLCIPTVIAHEKTDMDVINQVNKALTNIGILKPVAGTPAIPTEFDERSKLDLDNKLVAIFEHSKNEKDFIGYVKHTLEHITDTEASELWKNLSNAKNKGQLETVATASVGRKETTYQTLNKQVQVTRQAEFVKATDPIQAQANKQLKIDLAGDSKNMLVQAARRIARDLGKNGPITIDDVTQAMGVSYNVLPSKNGKRHNWKGSVFSKSEWIHVGTDKSRQVSAHCRYVGVWALKSWLIENTMNGKPSSVSSFIISKLYQDFQKANPKSVLKNCRCFVGDTRIATEIRDSIKRGENRLYGIPVSWIPGAVGAVIVPDGVTSI